MFGTEGARSRFSVALKEKYEQGKIEMHRTTVLITGMAIFSSLLTGCASIVSGTSQTISVETKYKGDSISGANCKLENGKGIFFVTTPGTITIHKAYADLLVTCEKVDVPEGLARVKSSTKAIAFGNILIGGVIGAGVDAGTGAAYDYPQEILVFMGEDIHIPALDQKPVPAQTSVATASATTVPISLTTSQEIPGNK